jgi:enoyl-CoA hydratase/carnithine racemase
LLTARPISAERARSIGLLNDLVEPGSLMNKALETADAIASNAPLAVAATRAGVRELLSLDLEQAYRRQEELGRPLRTTDDAREAQQAFAQKRKPTFRGQ